MGLLLRILPIPPSEPRADLLQANILIIDLNDADIATVAILLLATCGTGSTIDQFGKTRLGPLPEILVLFGGINPGEANLVCLV